MGLEHFLGQFGEAARFATILCSGRKVFPRTDVPDTNATRCRLGRRWVWTSTRFVFS
jgi:hypothetical protein